MFLLALLLTQSIRLECNKYCPFTVQINWCSDFVNSLTSASNFRKLFSITGTGSFSPSRLEQISKQNTMSDLVWGGIFFSYFLSIEVSMQDPRNFGSTGSFKMWNVGFNSEIFSLWLKPPKKCAKSLFWASSL